MSVFAQWPWRRVVRARPVEVATLAVLPVVVLLTLRVSPYFRLNNGDPFIYVGYSNSFVPIVHRFGYTYHSVRFGIIFPMRLSLVFGPVWGYFILRYLLYQLAVVSLFVALRTRGRAVALVGVLAFVCSPVAAQSILTTYHDTFVVPCCTALISLLVIARRQTGWRMWGCAAVAGVLAGWGINSNIAFAPLVMILAAMALVWLLIDRRWAAAAQCSVLFVVAMGLVFVAGIWVYSRDFHDADIFETTFNAIKDISGSNFWRTPGASWMQYRRYVFAPLVVVAIGAWRLWQGRGQRLDRELAMIFAATTLSIGYFFVQQFLLNAATLEQAYYFAYVLGPTCLLLAASLGRLVRPSGAGLAVLAGGPIALAWISQSFAIGSFLVFAFLVVVLLLVAGRVHGLALAGVATFAAMSLAWGAGPRRIPPSPGRFQYDPHYEIAFGDADRTAFDAYVLANKLTQEVPTGQDVQPPLLFWYATGDGLLDAVQGTYLWQNSTVQRLPEPGMPTLAADDLQRLRLVSGGYVVQLARRTDQLDAGMLALQSAGFVLTESPTVTMHSGSSTVYLRTLTVTDVPSPTEVSVGP